jgi:TolB-like protein/Flp pilus assembly protein TadD
MPKEQAPEPQASADRDVFVSYASQDAAVANEIAAALERNGLRCWIAPRDVRPGAQYADAIVGAINEARAVVVVLSASAVASSHVGREVERAASKHKPIIAFRTDDAVLNRALEYFLGESQWIDVPKLGMPEALTKLVEAVGSGSATSARQSPVTHRGVGATRRRVTIIAAILVCIGVAATLGLHFWSLSHRVAQQGAAKIEKSIAVLPFADMSEKHDQEYFADGMAEEILDLLAKIPGLHVPARTSSFYFKGKSEDIPTIARRLMVANVLEGSVRKSGNHVRVTVQLVRADNGYHLWSETYDRTLDDLFKVQDEIAGEVVRALKISMGTNTAARPVPTNSAEAHTLLLQAQFLAYRGTGDDTERAVSYYQQAIAIDPDFAEAWAGLSKALTGEARSSSQPRQQLHEPALRAAERAVALDPKLADAHCALGDVRFLLDWDWTAADAEYERARSLDSNNPHALNGAGGVAAVHGHLTDAVRLWEQAAARDPLNQFTPSALSSAYYAMGRFTEAVAATRKALELAPNFAGAHAFLAKMLLAAGQKDDALAEVAKESDPSSQAYALAWIYIVLGRRSDADAALAEVERKFAADQPYNIAGLHALRGDRDQAFSWLNRAYQQHDQAIVGTPITVDPDMKNLHGDPRWEVFLHKMKLR